MQLNELKDNDGARHRKLRVGRGIGSGKGKTAGRGQKGQKSRSGVAIKGFEGGQQPLIKRLPKRGFTNRNRVVHPIVNVGDLQKAVDEKRLDTNQSVNLETLKAAGLIRKNDSSVKLLAKGNLTAKLTIEATFASETAIKAVEKADGKVTVAEPKAKPEKKEKVDKKAG